VEKKLRIILERARDGVEPLEDLEKELLNLHSVSESYTKCWNCKHFTQTGTNYANKEVGNCRLHKCEVKDPKWQKCGEYDQCGLSTTFNFR
jgi:hypothetical protein